jgi:hypothetical protein
MRGAATVPGVALLSLIFFGTASVPACAAEWMVKPSDGAGNRCVLESRRQSIADGYQHTSVHFVVTARSVTLVSAAPLDAGSSDLGFTVDDRAFVPVDRLEGDRVAVFDSRYEEVVEQFKAGLRARVQLHFWPTWPATGTHTATLSLIGFTRAYRALLECR